MKIKEYRMNENGEFDILASFSHDEIQKMGFDTFYHFSEKERFMVSLIRAFERGFSEKKDKEKE